jgi:AraC-like DNA-binding protein
VLIIGQAGDDTLAVERLLAMHRCGVRRIDDGWEGYREARAGLADVAMVAPKGMPMEALALCWLVGRNERPGQMPFLFVADTPAQAIKAFGLGAADVLTYPYSPAEVVARIGVLLRQVGPPCPPRQDPAPKPDGAATPDDALLQAALEVIARDLAGVWTGPDLARRVGSSSKRLSRLFRQRTGMSVQRYVIARKMEAAAHLLACTRMPVADIARRVGYDALSNFSTTFRRYMGESATAYRQAAAARHSRG